MNIIPNYGMTNYQTNFRGKDQVLNKIVQTIKSSEKSSNAVSANAEELGTSALNVLQSIMRFHY